MRTIAFLLLSTVAVADSSGIRSSRPREWRDEADRILKRMDAWGRMTFYTHDEQGRVVEVALEGGGAHRFHYGPGGLEAEIDCVGRRHDFATPCLIDLDRGTALENHRHGGPPRATRFEYDQPARILQVTGN